MRAGRPRPCVLWRGNKIIGGCVGDCIGWRNRLGFCLVMTHAQIQYLQLVTTHQPLLRGFILSIAPGVDVDDVLQETNIVLWKKMDNFELGTNFKAFSSSVARLKTLEALRDQKSRAWLVIDSEMIERISERYCVAEVGKSNVQSALRTCLKGLQKSQLSLVHERYSKGKTVRAIAQEVNRNEGALQQAFFRIHNALRECINWKNRGRIMAINLHVTKLIGRALDQTIEAEEFSELQALLNSDQEVFERYCEQAELHGRLASELKPRDMATLAGKIAPLSERSSRVPLLIASVAALIILSGVGFYSF